MPNPRFEYRGCSIEVCPYEVRSGDSRGWFAQARIWYEDNGTLINFPLTGLAIESTPARAEAVILAEAKARIDHGRLPRRLHGVPEGKRTVTAGQHSSL